MAGRLITLIAGFLVASAWASIGHGQLADPTKPPAALAAPAPDAPAAGAAAVGLQSVIMRKNGKPAALINGEVVELGDKLGEAKLVKITEDAVVLRGPQGEETLRLTPAAEKKIGVGATTRVQKANPDFRGGSPERSAGEATAAGTKVGADGTVKKRAPGASRKEGGQ